MALLVIDTFTMYATANFAARGWTNSSMNISGGTGQSGLNSVNNTSTNSGGSVEYPIVANSDVTVGFCFKSSIRNVTNAPARIFEFRSGGSAVAAIAISASGQFEVWDMTGTQTLRIASAPNLHQAGIEHYIECRVKFSTTVGEAYLWLNGAPTAVASGTGLDTGGTSCDGLALIHNAGVGNNPFGTTDHSMFYALDSTGPAPHNAHLGHIRGAVLRPSGNGNQSDFVGSDGNQVDNYLLVDDTVPNDDTDYVYSSTPTDTDTYAMGNLPSTPQTIFAVQSLLWAKKTDAGSRSIAPVLRSGGTDYPGTDAALSTTYQYSTEIFIEDPDTPGTAWTESGVNAVEFGPKVAS